MNDTRKPGGKEDRTQKDADAFHDASIEWFYDVALDPLRMDKLVDDWENEIAKLRAAADFDNPELLNDRKIMGHVRRAKAVLARSEAANPADHYEAALSPFESVSALIVGEDLTIKATNDIALMEVGLGIGARIRDFPLHPNDVDQLVTSIQDLLDRDHQDLTILSFREPHSERISVLRLQLVQADNREPSILLAANGIVWPAGLNDTLNQVFGLTPAETSVLRSLIELGTINDIAISRSRSVDTIRGQIKSIMTKTETHSQVELARLTISIMKVADTHSQREAAPKITQSGNATLENREFHSIYRAGGRQVTYLVLGDPHGLPVLYLSAALGLVRWPAEAEAEAMYRGLKIIVPVRPGYGDSDPVSDAVNYDAALISDAIHILDAQKVQTCPILSLDDDSYYAFEIARAIPQRVRALIATSGVLPLTRAIQFERMKKWHRFLMAGARYTPHLLPFMARSASYMTQKIGKRRFLHAVFGDSPGDVATFEDPGVFEALSCGSEIMMSDSHYAHQAFSQQFVGGKNEDWSATVISVRIKTPVIFMNGDEDPQVPLATLSEFQQDHPWIDFRIFEGSGNLLFFQRWREVIDVIQEYPGTNRY